MRNRYLKLLRDPHEVGQGWRRHLLHHVPAVDLKRDLADPKFSGRLLVEKPADDKRQHFAFARRQSEVALLEDRKFGPFRMRLPVLRHRGADRLHEVRVAERFGQEVDGAVLDGPDRRGDVAMAGYEHDRRMIAFRYLPLEVQAVDVRQFDIQNEARRQVRLSRLDVLAGGGECDRRNTVRSEQFAERLANAYIVVNDEDDIVVVGHAVAFASIGSVKTNAAPGDAFFSAHNFPPWDSMIERQIASPMPIPCPFVVKNGSNIRSGCSMPRPRSRISV